MIYEIAKFINENGIDTSKFQLALVKGTSETIFEHYQAEVKNAFGVKMISEYGSAESGIIAFECPHGAMHLNMEGCIVEEDNGEVIVTNLNAYSFPIIRYKLGDYIELEDENYACPCGMAHRVLRKVTGRIGKRILGSTQSFPSLTVYYILKNIYEKTGVPINGQFIQTKRGQISLRVQENLSREIRGTIDGELEKYFGEEMDWEVEENADIHTMDGKRKDFISTLE